MCEAKLSVALVRDQWFSKSFFLSFYCMLLLTISLSCFLCF